MGSDLYHYRATSAPNDNIRFRADEFDAEAIEQLGFGRFLQIIPDTDWPCRILIAADRASLDHAFRPNIGYKNPKLLAWFVGRPRDFQEHIEAIERQHGLDAARREASSHPTLVMPDGYSHGSCGFALDLKAFEEFDWHFSQSVQDSFKRIPNHSAGSIRNYLTIRYPTPDDFLSFHVEEVGYQRKGMKSGFYEAFSSPFLHWHRADVEKAMTFLDHDSSDDPETQRQIVEHFRVNFLDNFEEGRSLFSGCY